MPCYKLALRFDRDDMIKHFLTSGRSGFYFSVIEPGEVSAGQKIEIVNRDPPRSHGRRYLLALPLRNPESGPARASR